MVILSYYPIHTTFHLDIIKKWLNSNLTCGKKDYKKINDKK